MQEVPVYVRHTDSEVRGFFGPYRFLSNFHPAAVYFGGVQFSSTEKAYQAAKAEDKELYAQFARMSSAEAKAAGRQIQLRSDWAEVKNSIMLELNLQKFRDAFLRDKLLATGARYLEELNHWNDRYWGVSSTTQKGRNQLGITLMTVREYYGGTGQVPNPNFLL